MTNPFLQRQSLMRGILAVLFGVFAVMARIAYETEQSLRMDLFVEKWPLLLFHFVFSVGYSLSGFYLWLLVYKLEAYHTPYTRWRYMAVVLGFLVLNAIFFATNNVLQGKAIGAFDAFELVFLILHFSTFATIWVFGDFFLAFQKNFEISLENEQLKRERLKNQLEALRNQLSPHFLFNALNILNISIVSDPEAAQKIVYDLSDILRYNLKVQNQSLSSLEDELKAARSYLDLYKARFGDKLVYYFLDSKPTREWFVIPLSLQLLIENAIKHNVITSKRVLLIEIRLEEKEKQLLVINSVNRKKNVPGTGIGLKNLDKRYRLQVEESPELQVDDEQFMVKLPLIEGP